MRDAGGHHKRSGTDLGGDVLAMDAVGGALDGIEGPASHFGYVPEGRNPLATGKGHGCPKPDQLMLRISHFDGMAKMVDHFAVSRQYSTGLTRLVQKAWMPCVPVRTLVNIHRFSRGHHVQHGRRVWPMMPPPNFTLQASV